MFFALLLTFGLLTACGKDDPDDLDGNLKAAFSGNNNKSYSNDSIQYPTYEANWVQNRQVIDKTVIRNIDNQRLEITNMPNEVLLRHLLTNEQQNLPIKQLTSLYYTYTTVGYNTSMYYTYDDNSMAAFYSGWCFIAFALVIGSDFDFLHRPICQNMCI